MILHNYPNHDYTNGTLYRGLITKRIVKPDNNGFYAVRFMGAIHRLTEQEILTATVKKDLIIPPAIVKTNPVVSAKINVSSLRRPLGVKFSTYHKWAQNNGYFNKTAEYSNNELFIPFFSPQRV